MKTGYGRGYYGAGQLAPQPQSRGSSGWVKLALVVGVGAAVWYLWPRKPKLDYDNESGGGGGNGTRPPFPPPPPPPEWHSTQAVPLYSEAAVNQGSQLLGPPSPYQDAQSRGLLGYLSQQAYEDAVVTSARQLQDTGARVTFAPHLQHLTPRLGP